MPHFYHDPFDPTQVYYNPLPDDATPEELEEYQRIAIKSVVRSILTFAAVLVLLAIMSLFTGCTTQKVVTVERVTHDTVQITRQQRDSIFLRDSIYVHERTSGDTVFLEVSRWHTQYRDRWHHDSILIARTDSIPVPYPVEKRVPAQLSSWQNFQLWTGRLVLIALALCAAVWLLRRYIKSRLRLP